MWVMLYPSWVELTHRVSHPGCRHSIAAFDSTSTSTTIPHKHPLRAPIWRGALLCLPRPDASTVSSLSGPTRWISVTGGGVLGDLDYLFGSCGSFMFRSVQTSEFNANEDSLYHFPRVLRCSWTGWNFLITPNLVILNILPKICLYLGA